MIPISLTPAALVAYQSPPVVEAKRWYWCNQKNSTHHLNIEIKVDGQRVGNFVFPLRLGEVSKIPDETKQRIAEYHFDLKPIPNRDFRGVTKGRVEGNFWVALATNDGIDFGHSWVCQRKIILHEMVPVTVGKNDLIQGDGIQISINWLPK
jgi:hypothetical protein